MGKSRDASHIRALAGRALARGGSQETRGLTLARAASCCLFPRGVHQFHTAAEKIPVLGYSEPGREVAYMVPCRECSGCKRARAATWYARILKELRASVAYFVTLTLNPDNRFLLDCKVRQSEPLSSEPAASFKQRTRALVPDVQMYVKRVRKRCPFPLRYCFVVEPHADHYPHVHILWHVPVWASPELGERGYPKVFEEKWDAGFVSANGKVADDGKAASYVAKYLSKEVTGFIRASVRYGRSVLPTEPSTSEASYSASAELMTHPRSATAQAERTDVGGSDERGDD